MSQAWIEIEVKHLEHNFLTLKNFLKSHGLGTEIAPCIKSEAYSHGLVEVAQVFSRLGAKWFCVNSLEEATKLRKSSIKADILILGHTPVKDLMLVLKGNFVLNLHSLDLAQKYATELKNFNSKLRLHLEVDTGMSRLGVLTTDCLEVIKFCQNQSSFSLEGIFTHFGSSDDVHSERFFTQINKFEKVREQIEPILNKNILFHCCNSSALVRRPDLSSDLVRPGLLLYGFYPSVEIQKICQTQGLNFLPAITFKSKIVQIKNISSNTEVSYGNGFITSKPTKIGILPVGYADGLNRLLSNTESLEFKGQKVKILGRVCMNMTIIDLTDIDSEVGDVVTLISSDNLESQATSCGTINYDILSSLPSHLKRVYIPPHPSR
jgi:alanine racemase